MQLRSHKQLLRVQVGFNGLDEPDDVPLRSAVWHERPPMLEGNRSALAPLIPLTAVRLLHNSAAEPAISSPMMSMLNGAAEELLDDESAAQDFDFASRVALPWDDAAELERRGLTRPDEKAEAFYRGVPELVFESTERPDQGFATELRRNRSGTLWAKIDSPLRGPAFFAAYGLFAVIEQTARYAPYEAVTVPALAGLAAFTHTCLEVFGGEGWESLGAMAAFQEVAAEVAMAPDSREALEDVRHGTHAEWLEFQGNAGQASPPGETDMRG